MATLSGRRIAVLEGRMPAELANLVRRRGGVPYSVPAVHEAPLDCRPQVANLIARLSGGEIGFSIFLTGAGVRALCAEAEQLQQLPLLIDGLQQTTVVCRGPKPQAALAQVGLATQVRVGTPFTSAALLAALADRNLAGEAVLLVHYGERDRHLAGALHDRGAMVEELCLYEWQLPTDQQGLRTLIDEIIAGRVDAVAFTSQVQARHLLLVAEQHDRTAELVAALNRRTVVASLAPTCLAALRERGIEPRVVPEHSKSGHLIEALVRHFDPTAPD